MIPPIVPILAVACAAAGADPCALPLPEDPEPSVAAAYAEVAQEDVAAGRREQAAAAFREALRRAHGDLRVRAGFASVCRSPESVALARRGMALLAAGSLSDAVSVFEEARSYGAYPEVALAQAVCHLRLADDARARVVLAEALAGGSTADAAQLLVALLERRASRRAAVRTALEAAARSGDPHVADAAARLLDEVRADGPLAVTVYAGSTWDSNERLAPDGVPTPGGTGDVGGILLAAADVKPLGANGPFVRGSADVRAQARFGEHDGAGWAAGAGWSHGDARRAISGEYRRRSATLGRAPYLTSDAVLVRANAASFGRVAIFGGARWESIRYAPDHARSFSGVRYMGDLGAALAGNVGWLALAYVGAVMHAEEQPLSYVEHSPRIVAGLLPARWLRAWAECAFAARRYAAVDPALGLRRGQLGIDTGVGADLALAGGLSVRLQVGWRSVSANVASLSYEKWVASGGLAWERSWP